jgi:hypothetical protein
LPIPSFQLKLSKVKFPTRWLLAHKCSEQLQVKTLQQHSP